MQKLMFVIKLRLYPFLHRLICDGNLEILVPTEDYMLETGDNEVYMLCPECNRKYHLTYLTPAEKDDSEQNEGD